MGTTGSGAAIGASLGGIGQLASPLTSGLPDVRLVVLAALLLAGALLDWKRTPLSLPTIRRQVNADWLDTYRGHVYGFGFGVQLGAGAATIVNSSLLYLSYVAALLTGSVSSGLLIGATFGAVRGAALIPSARVTRQELLARLAVKLDATAEPVRRFVLATQLAMGAALMLIVVI